MKQYILSVAVGVMASLLAGCAYVRVRPAFDRPDIAAGEQTPIAASVGFSSGSRSLPNLNENSTLTDYLTYAALNNPGLEAAFNRWKAALEKVTQERTLPDPQLTYQVDTRDPELYKVGLSQTFPWFGKRGLQGDMALQTANAERQQYEAAKLKLFYEVKKAYFELYYVGRAIAVADENVKLLTYMESVARAKYTAGAPTYAAVIKAQVELGKMENELRTLRILLQPVIAELNAALNRPSNSPLPVPRSIPEDKVVFSDEQLVAWLGETNPELKAMSFMAAQEKAGVDLAKKMRYPDIMVGVDYMTMEDPFVPGMMNSKEDTVMAMLSINLPIWYSKYRAAEREARARYVASVKDRTDRQNNLLAELQMALYDFRDGERRIDLYRNSLLPKAEQSLQATQRAFEADRADFLDLIEAQRTLLEFKLSCERALADRAQRLAELEMLAGREIPRSDEAGAQSAPKNETGK